MRRSIRLILFIAVLCCACLGCVRTEFANDSEKWMQKVLDAVTAEDSTALKSLFDPALADDLDTQTLFDFIAGDIASYEFTLGPSYLSTHGGLFQQWDIGCDFITSSASYRMAIRITGSETDMAVQSLYIIRTEDIDPDAGYWGGIDFSSGITIARNSE